MVTIQVIQNPHAMVRVDAEKLVGTLLSFSYVCKGRSYPQRMLLTKVYTGKSGLALQGDMSPPSVRKCMRCTVSMIDGPIVAEIDC